MPESIEADAERIPPLDVHASWIAGSAKVVGEKDIAAARQTTICLPA